MTIGAVVSAVFVANESRAQQPIMPLRLFASRQRSGAAISRLLFAGAMIAFFFFTTQFLQGVYGWNPLQAGLAFLPMTIVQFVFSLFVPRLTQRYGTGWVLVTGLAFVLAGMAWMTQLTADTSYVVGVTLPMVLIGFGQGLAFGPLTAAGIAGAHIDDAGAASGLVNTAHQLGSTLGVALLTAVAAGATTIAARVVDAYIGGAVMLAIALLAAVVLILPAERTARSRPKGSVIESAAHH
ncbi:MFS transporter [Nocardia sp. NPDC058518]|uniref:MFS transporter n=1 Tax=Nocardia sp. NPDC058518 TaxID=3346534 RepID=UPI00365E3B4F